LIVDAILKRKGNKVETIESIDLVQLAAQRMRQGGIAALVVLEKPKILGVLAEGDIVRAISHCGASALSMMVAQIIHQTFVSITPTDSLKRVMDLMTNNRVRHLPVIAHGELCGIVKSCAHDNVIRCVGRFFRH
jgi:CBS domain-containing protein